MSTTEEKTDKTADPTSTQDKRLAATLRAISEPSTELYNEPRGWFRAANERDVSIGIARVDLSLPLIRLGVGDVFSKLPLETAEDLVRWLSAAINDAKKESIYLSPTATAAESTTPEPAHASTPDAAKSPVS
ncbi:MAG: hypothetical protein ACHREM_04770 [Polyangiales bacterium]